MSSIDRSNEKSTQVPEPVAQSLAISNPAVLDFETGKRPRGFWEAKLYAGGLESVQ